MIAQYLSNTNEISTIHILQNILQVNKEMTANDSNIEANKFKQIHFIIKQNIFHKRRVGS